MEEKRFLEDVPSDLLIAKLRRAKGSMSEAILFEILHRGVVVDNSDSPKIEYVDPPAKTDY